MQEVSQTALSVDDIIEVIRARKRKYPGITEPKKADICYATTNRQEAVKFMAPQVDLVIVVGSPNSSNSNRPREVAENNWIEAYMVDNATQIDSEKVNLLPFVSFGHTSIWNKGCNG